MKNKGNNHSKYLIPKTLSQSIYISIRESIIKNEIKASQKINENEIANLYEVSKTPVREALVRLAAEGFVTIDSHKEIRVKEVSYKELEEIFLVLGHLDGLAMCSVLDNLNQEDFEEIEEMISKMEDCCNLKAIEEYTKINDEFHMKLWNLLPNICLKETLNFINNQRLRYIFARLTAFEKKPKIIERSLSEHTQIFEALKNKNKKSLKILALKHWKVQKGGDIEQQR